MGGQIETNRWRGIDRCCRVVVKGRVRGNAGRIQDFSEQPPTLQSLPPSLSVQLCPSALAAAPASSLLVRSSGASFPREIPRQRLPPVWCLPLCSSAIREKGRMKFQGPSRRARSLVNAEGHNDKDSCTTSRVAVFFLATRENSLWDFVSIYSCFTLTQPFSLRGRERAPLAWNIDRTSQMQNSDPW